MRTLFILICGVIIGTWLADEVRQLPYSGGRVETPAEVFEQVARDSSFLFKSSAARITRSLSQSIQAQQKE